MTLTIRPARLEEAHTLSELCKRSKAHWGYDAGFMALSEASLTIQPEQIAAGHVLVAEHEGRTVAVANLKPMGGGTIDLQHLFVEPDEIDHGIGRRLFGAACDLARTLGGTMLSILSDPYAEAFYKQMGATRIGDAPSDAVPDRMLPLFEYPL
ncbi:MAG: GNAT family N-acetyltransferase [Rhizomicrobium sp.]